MLLASYPQAIIHVDADAFFASVEQAIHPELAGKPIITGAERGMVIALSYEAKAFGVKRGMLVNEARRLCPGLLTVPSDYETYGLFSKRIFEIMRQYTPQVEEYSIDEAFADLSGLRRLHRSSYPQIAKRMKEEIESDLGITVSAGLSLSKSLAKLASKYNKPSGVTAVPGRSLEDFLKHNTIDKVWGFGPNSVALLHKQGIKTILDFIQRPHSFAKKLFGKIGSELWHELSGTSIYEVNSAEKTSYQSISKFKTFSPVTTDPEFLFGQLLRNVERALAKMRRFHLATRRLVIILRSRNFIDDVLEITLSRYTTAALDLVRPVRDHFDQLFKPGTKYRASGVVLCDLKNDRKIQLSIFDDPVRMVRAERLDCAVDALNRQYGRHAIHLADSLAAEKKRSGARNTPPSRRQNLLKGESKRQRLNIPVLQMKLT